MFYSCLAQKCSTHLRSRLVKAQCIRSYGFLKALLHMVGSYIQMQLLIGRLPSCQLFSIVCRKEAYLFCQIATWPSPPALKDQHGTMASESLSVVALIMNRSRWRLAQRNRARTNECLALRRQKRHSSAPTGPCELLLSFIRWASTHDAMHALHAEEKWHTKKSVEEPLAPVSRAIWGRQRGGTYGIHFLRVSSCSAHMLYPEWHRGRSQNTDGR